MTSPETAILFRRALLVRRWHTVPNLLTVNTTAEHSAQILNLLFCLHPAPTIELIKFILYHDAHESQLGDIPSPVKKLPILRDAIHRMEEAWDKKHGLLPESGLSDEDRIWFKSLDCLDGLLFCLDQLETGPNPFLAEIAERYKTYLAELGVPQEVRDLLIKLKVI